MRVEYHRKAFRELESIARGDRVSAKAIADMIDKLADEPRPHGCETLDDTILRIRVRDYRVIYGLNEKEKLVAILKIVRRSETTYRGLEKLVRRFKRMGDSAGRF
jgi:mRNA interferase RelE/StbE